LPSKTSLLRMEQISKSFPGVKALDYVNISLNHSELLALLGENGAGKSTLMKILAGVNQPDSGTIFMDGEKVRFETPKDSQRQGISIIYQEFNLIPHISIAENIFLGREPRKLVGVIDWKQLDRQTKALLKKVGLEHLSTRELISNLSVAEQQLIEITKALSYASKIIIMDEPTAALNDEDTRKLFSIIKDLKKEGLGIIYITHRLEEIEQIADSVSVLRDGKYIGSLAKGEFNHEKIVNMMVGRDVHDLFPKRQAIPTDVVMQVKNLSLDSKLENISFDIKQGEIIGVAGLLGSGRTDLSKALFGLYKKITGEVIVKSKHIKTPKDAIDAGIALVTDDRKQEGLVLGLSVSDNLLLPSLRKISKNGILHKVVQTKIVNKWINELKIKVANSNVEVNTLSGGNQQKVVLAKWLQMNPKLLILNEPTRGIDIGAKQEIYQLISRLSEQGIAILMISSEMPELLGLSDRVLVMKNGKIVKELLKKEVTQEKIFLYASGGES
jgi:ribose transport system ATP-binding protein